MRCAPLLVLLVALVGARAARAEPCAVTVDAPDEAREAIITWVAAEPACGPPLDVHVVSGDGGLEVTASDPTGRHFTRVAPDVQTVAALVASWAATDEIPQDPVPVAVVATVPPSRASDGAPWRAMSIAATIGSRKYGARGEIDFVTLGHWVAGVSVGVQNGSPPDNSASKGWTSSTERDVDAFAQVGYERTVHGWHARASAGAGVEVVYVSDVACTCNLVISGPEGSQQANPLFALEASLTLRHSLGADWELMFGGSVIVLPQAMATVFVTNNWYDTENVGHVSPAGLVGFGHRW